MSARRRNTAETMLAHDFTENISLITLDELEANGMATRRLVNEGRCIEERVHTDRGSVLVAVQGDRANHAILTYHDLGLNYVSFQSFFKYVDMRALLSNFCVYHVNAPGQEEGARSLPDDYAYPSMDELAGQLHFVLAHFNLKSFIGFGVGAGANILIRFAIANPQKVDALTLINCTPNQAGWMERARQKMTLRALRARTMPDSVLDDLMQHHFGREAHNQKLSGAYREYIGRHARPLNLAYFMESYSRRTDIGIHRDGNVLRVPVLNVTGTLSPHVATTVDLNARLLPAISTWMKISDCAMLTEERPEKLSEAFRLFVQGEGYAAPLSPSKIAAYRQLSDAERSRPRPLCPSRRSRRSCPPCRRSSAIRITENPISDVLVC